MFRCSLDKNEFDVILSWICLGYQHRFVRHTAFKEDTVEPLEGFKSFDVLLDKNDFDDFFVLDLSWISASIRSSLFIEIGDSVQDQHVNMLICSS